MISGFCKTYNCSFEYVLNGMSFQNVVMYSKVIPSYVPNDEKNKKNKTDKKVISKDEHNDFLKSLINKQKNGKH